MEFGKVLTAMITPFTPEGTVNLKEAKKIARHLIDNGNDGLVLIGTTGESPTLTLEEKIELVDVISNEVKGKAKIIVGTGSNNTVETLRTTKAFENNTNIDGIMVVTPYYNKPTQKGLILHFEKIALSTKLPIMLYNVPSRTGGNILPDTVKKLSNINNITAIKEASGDLVQVSEIADLCGDNIDIYSGEDSLTLPMLSVGAKGVVSVAGHVVGKEIHNMIDEFFLGNYDKAREIHLKLLPIFKNLFIETNPIPVKAAMQLLGFKTGVCRLPLSPPNDKTIEILKETLKLK
ncbi:4-hydroxy-tetrahydrodipicolinate synthase [Alkalicella caledoniensis]|uniref:4-hydroxy-tetrahydrodipicolinate synthase n=1 Tax=Alkalicella caledoniensis TaxID=2731377 RepID=A0A7G9WCR6_ALKCA|nr:4-hydroxy-tetrahydrodipicolinate synthase [Alkalicella caledoniensis]QNO16478.1 4-hydroxy-tetrahydrodipicolinate synthase [Alkalicella caledoniensis]